MHNLLQDASLTEVAFDDAAVEWVFTFTQDVTIRIAAPWRVVIGDDIRLGWDDNQQTFGRLAPLDGAASAMELIDNHNVVSMNASALGDLVIDFGDGISLEIFNASCGYEGWTLHGPKGQWLAGQGGGGIVGGTDE